MAKKVLSKEEIIHLAKLANLQLTDKEILKYQEQIGETLDYVKNLDEVDTSEVSTTNHAIDLKNVVFNDDEKDMRQLTNEEALANTKNKKDDFFLVKRIL